jgi:hypothetical protein
MHQQSRRLLEECIHSSASPAPEKSTSAAIGSSCLISPGQRAGRIPIEIRLTQVNTLRIASIERQASCPAGVPTRRLGSVDDLA